MWETPKIHTSGTTYLVISESEIISVRYMIKPVAALKGSQGSSGFRSLFGLVI